MLEGEHHRRLRHLTEAVTRDDPRFAAALARGKPCAPWEYRRRRRIILLSAVLPTVVVCAAGHPVIGLLLGWSAALLAIVCTRHLLQNPRQRGDGPPRPDTTTEGPPFFV
jgi:hypothetical protein